MSGFQSHVRDGHCGGPTITIAGGELKPERRGGDADNVRVEVQSRLVGHVKFGCGVIV
jgi:hypothetical protein